MVNYTLEKVAQIVNGKLLGDPNQRIHGVQFDSRLIQPGNLFVPIKGERVDGHNYIESAFNLGAVASFWEENNENEKPAGNIIVVENSVKALTALASQYRKDSDVKIIGVTGSSGKTSTKDIINSVISSKYNCHKTSGNQNNEIGVPMTLLNCGDEAVYNIVEMGISDFNEMEPLVEMVNPDITVICSIGPAHIAQFKTMDNIAIEKCKINLHLGNGQCFYNYQAYHLNEVLTSMNLQNKAIGYGYDEGADLIATDIIMSNSQTTFKVDGKQFSLPILGKHQVLNALSAISVGRYCGLTDEEIQAGLNSVVLTPHRLQLRHIGKATIIDDTYNSNPLSCSAAIQTIVEYQTDDIKIAVLGDMLELGEHSAQLHASLAEAADFNCFEKVYLVGDMMSHLYDKLKDKGIDCYHFDNNDQVKDILKEYLDKDCVMLFKASNGIHFTQLINDLEESL